MAKKKAIGEKPEKKGNPMPPAPEPFTPGVKSGMAQKPEPPKVRQTPK